MHHSSPNRMIGDLALLYLTVVQGRADELSNAELEAVTESLHSLFPNVDRVRLQNSILESLAAHLDLESLQIAAREAAGTLDEALSEAQKHSVLEELVRVARADGVLLDRERELIQGLATAWRVEIPEKSRVPQADPEPGDQAWDALHHLAYIYLVLAHATDNEFSEDERQLVLKKLQEWRPALQTEQVASVLERAMERYAYGPDPERLAESVEAVKRHLPEKQRMAALHDLIQIANADGVFLDSEEDLINNLLAAWDVDAYASYGSHGSKESE